jgi:hypothetical protein
VYQTDPAHADKTQLYLGPNALSANDASALHADNPGVLILPSVNVADSGDESLPDDYFLKDVNGKRIADWCSSPPGYVLNLTEPQVSTFLANYALEQSTSAFDGAFFDSFSTTIPQPFTDCYGNQVRISSKNNGVPDNPDALNAAWAAGEYLVVSAFRSLAPYTYLSGHVGDTPPDPGSLAAFNGTSIVFDAVNVREGLMAFGTLWNMYQTWEAQSVAPAITMIQSSPCLDERWILYL